MGVTFITAYATTLDELNKSHTTLRKMVSDAFIESSDRFKDMITVTPLNLEQFPFFPPVVTQVISKL
jgi:hypothetical protein